MQTERYNNAANDNDTQPRLEYQRIKHGSVYPQPNTPPPQAFHSAKTAIETPGDDVEEGRQRDGPVPLQSQDPPPRRCSANKLLLFWLYLALLVVACTVAGLVVGLQGKNDKNKDGVESMASVPMDTSMVPMECTPKVHKTSNAKFSLDSTKIVAPGTYQFGYRVAIHDDMAVVGGEGSSRSAHVFVRGAGNTWKRQAVLKGPNNEPLGSSGVGIYCGTAIVGSMYDKNKQGSAHIFVQTTDSNWVHQAKLVAPDGALGDTFGASVGIFEDTVIIGSPKDARSGNFMGSAYIFVRNGNSWTYQSKLMASDAAAYDEFGTSVG